MVNYKDNPKTNDEIYFDLLTTDEQDDLIQPYELLTIKIYFLEREKGIQKYQTKYSHDDLESTYAYKNAIPVKVLGSEDEPVWTAASPEDSQITESSTGVFRYVWNPSSVKEGDYFLCYTWKETSLSDVFAETSYFTLATPENSLTIRSRRTREDKYDILLERYLPMMFKMKLVSTDLTPDVLNKLNLAVANGFKDLEDLANQLYDLIDANTVNEFYLPYLANYFGIELRSEKSSLWRAQTRNAIPLLKKKGTISGLHTALAEAGIQLSKLTTYWQVVSKSTWQEVFAWDEGMLFNLQKQVLLPVDDNFTVWIRKADTVDYIEQDINDVDFYLVPGNDIACETNTADYWQLGYLGTEFEEGDLLKIKYKVLEPEDQNLEDYICTLDLADLRDEFDITFPLKNWNIRLIADDDPLFGSVCPQIHEFQYPLVYGRVRTIFPYSENIYNMEEYNGSFRDSNKPCDLDSSFSDSCSCCKSSKISLDLVIQDLSDNRMQEANEIIKEYVPIDCQIHSINYKGIINDFIPAPIETIDCFGKMSTKENIVIANSDFNRIIENGLSDLNELLRNELATQEIVATGNDGTIQNLAVQMNSAIINFLNFGVKPTSNYLEVLSGTHTGTYELSVTGEVQSFNPTYLDESAFFFNFSNIQFEETGVDIYQDDFVIFTGDDYSMFLVDTDWIIRISSLDYTIEEVYLNGRVKIQGWGGPTTTGLVYELVDNTDTVVYSSTGRIDVTSVGRIETSLIQEWDVQHGDWFLIDGVEYQSFRVGERPPSPTVDTFYLLNWTDGTQVGSVDYKVLRRKLTNSVGYFSFTGTKLVTTVDYETTFGIQNGENPPSPPLLETSDFKENYLVLIDGLYYQIQSIDETDMILNGKIFNWGLFGTNVSYEIHKFDKIAFTAQNGEDLLYMDRRNESTPHYTLDP